MGIPDKSSRQETLRQYELRTRDPLQHTAVWWFAVSLLCLCAARAASYGLGRSLWTAETWVATSVCTSRVREMFFYPTWLQTTPPLFLLVVRTVIQIFGLSNYTLRAVPFALHLTTVLIMAVFARRAFAPSLALLCVTLVAISPSGIRYAEELKQYAGDEAVSALLILLLWLLVEGERRALSMLLIALPIVVFFSHTSVFFLPLITGTVLFTRRALPLRTRLIQAGLLSFAGIALSIANYWLFVRPNLSSHLIEYWEFG